MKAPVVSSENGNFMKGVNILPGVQAWSKAHDYYLSNQNPTNRPFGSHIQATIVPFVLMGTYAGMYGFFTKPLPNGFHNTVKDIIGRPQKP